MKLRKLWPLLLVVLIVTGIACPPHEDKPPPPVPKETEVEIPRGLQERLDAARKIIRDRQPLTNMAFWTIFHYILGIGPDSAELFDVKTGKLVNAMDQICHGTRDTMRGLEFEIQEDGSVEVISRPGSGENQGHQDQFVAEMVQWGLPKDREFIVKGKKRTFEDFIRNSKNRASLTKKQELSWTVLIVAQHYGTDHRWTNNFGETLTLEDLLRYEIKDPIDLTTACGGTHRLFGLTWVYNLHRKNHGKKEGAWKDTADYLDKYKKLARQNQNADGSFSTKYISEPDNERDPQLRINTTGHVLEWLALMLPDDELRQKWVQDAAQALAKMILERRSLDIDSGGLYHAAHGLEIYRTRLFGPADQHPPHFLPVPKD